MKKLLTLFLILSTFAVAEKGKFNIPKARFIGDVTVNDSLIVTDGVGGADSLVIWNAGDSVHFVSDNPIVFSAGVTVPVDALSQDLDANGYYILNEQGSLNLRANALPSPYYRFDGSDDVITKSNDSNLNFGSSTDFTILVRFMTDSIPTNQRNLVGKKAGFGTVNAGYSLSLTSSGYLTADISDGSNYLSGSINDFSVCDGKWHLGAVSADRSGNAILYIDGIPYSTTDMSSIGDIDDVGQAFEIGGISGYRFTDVQISSVDVFNLALTASEVKQFMNGSIPFKYQGASQTELLVADGTFATSTGWTLGGGWTIGGGVASCTGTGATHELTDQNVPATTGKKYRVTFEVTANTLTGSGNLFGLQGDSPWELGTGSNIFQDDSGADLWAVGVHNVSFVHSNGTGTGTKYLKFQLVSAATGGSISIDNVSVVQIGAVAEYDGSSASTATWYDKSGNDLDGTVSGASLENTFEAIPFSTGAIAETADNTLTVSGFTTWDMGAVTALDFDGAVNITTSGNNLLTLDGGTAGVELKNNIGINTAPGTADIKHGTKILQEYSDGNDHFVELIITDVSIAANTTTTIDVGIDWNYFDTARMMWGATGQIICDDSNSNPVHALIRASARANYNGTVAANSGEFINTTNTSILNDIDFNTSDAVNMKLDIVNAHATTEVVGATIHLLLVAKEG